MNSAGGSALFEIVKSGVDINKLVIGKPGASSDADSGFIDPETLGACIRQAVQQGWNAGVMAFEVRNVNAMYSTQSALMESGGWIRTVSWCGYGLDLCREGWFVCLSEGDRS